LAGLFNAETDVLTVNDEFTTSIVIARCRQRESGAFRWLIRFDTGLKPDLTVAVRMDSENQRPLDYYLLPSLDLAFEKLSLAEDKGNKWGGHRRMDKVSDGEGALRGNRIPDAELRRLSPSSSC
jgi:hypothetical protein